MYVIDFGYQLYVSLWKRQFLKRHAWIYTWMEFKEQAHMDGIKQSEIPYNLG
jgi:hypothetical protein